MSIKLNKKDRKRAMRSFYKIIKNSDSTSKYLLIKRRKTKSKTVKLRVASEKIYFRTLSKQFYKYGNIFNASTSDIELTNNSIVEIPLENKLKAITTVGTLKAIRKSEIENETYQ